MKAWNVASILQELIDDNPFAVRALLQIVSIEETTAVPTLAVTAGESPRLLINPEFIAEHCHTDEHLKAVICHEFLHVLLRHTEQVKQPTPAEHLALDAVINAIIHRTLGPAYSDMMKRYYARERGLGCLLRPFEPRRLDHQSLSRAWWALYDGKLVVDDVRELAEQLARTGRALPRESRFIGNHRFEKSDEPDGPVAEAIKRALSSMNGSGIWRSPKSRGVGAPAYDEIFSASDLKIEQWRRTALAVLRRHVVPDPKAPREWESTPAAQLPVLSPGHRRSFLQALWSPLIPDAAWPNARPVEGRSTHVYLDVSGSMSAEMPLIVGLLGRLGRYIRRPFWAFSNKVAPARIVDGRLLAATTGGTSMRCVLEHLAKTAPARAVVVTDGYIERLAPSDLLPCRGTRLHAIVTRDGSPEPLRRAGIPYTQLAEVPR